MINNTVTGTSGADIIAHDADGINLRRNDLIFGLQGDDSINSFFGNDIVYGGNGDDIIEGRVGNDILYGFNENGSDDGSNDTLDGGDNLDTLYGGAGSDYLLGGGGNDRLLGGDDADTLNGGAQDDILLGGGGGDILNGGSGRDVASYLDSVTGILVDLNDTTANNGIAAGDTYLSIEVIVGSDGNDDLRGDGDGNQLEGRIGDDLISGRDGNDDLRGGDGNDVIIGGTGADRHEGGSGIDTASYADTNTGMLIDLASNGLNTGIAAGDGYTEIENLIGSGGNDDVRGDIGANTIDAGDGHDFIFGRNGDDNLIGGNGDDNLRGGSGGDTLNGGEGIDSANYIDSVGLTADLRNSSANTGVAAGDSYISIENLYGSNGDDNLRGDISNNTLEGRDGDDSLSGRNGDDVLVGGNGNDVLRGNNGFDTLSGNAGDDTFRFDTTVEGTDTIRDFKINRDIIALNNSGFSSLLTGSLSSDSFIIGTSAVDGNDYIIYNSTTGDLFYDEDGIGAAAQIRFANLQNKAAIDENDFLVI